MSGTRKRLTKEQIRRKELLDAGMCTSDDGNKGPLRGQCGKCARNRANAIERGDVTEEFLISEFIIRPVKPAGRPRGNRFMEVVKSVKVKK